MAYRRFKRRRYVKRDRRPTWAKIMHTGYQMYNNLKGPLGYALRGVNMLRNLVNTEAKYCDTVSNTGAGFDNNTGLVIPLCHLAQGTTDTTRIGNSILGKHLTINWAVTQNPSNTSGNRFRIIVFIDKQNAHGITPQAQELLMSVIPTSQLNIDNLDRFVVLRNVMGHVDPDNPVRSGKMFIPLHRLHIKYDGIGAGQGTLAENGIYILYVSNQGTNTPIQNTNARLAFYDN